MRYLLAILGAAFLFAPFTRADGLPSPLAITKHVYRNGRLMFTGNYKKAKDFLVHRQKTDGGQRAVFILVPATTNEKYKRRHKHRSH